MTMLINNHQTDNLTPFLHVTSSLKAVVITCLALAILSALVIALSGWANAKVAALYGAENVIKHSSYVTMPAYAIALCLLGAIPLLIYVYQRQHRQHQHVELAETLDTTPLQKPINPALLQVLSPMQGICFLKCVQGALVQKGDILCILEAMKMESSILAAETGTIKNIYVTNGAMIDFNKPIISLDTHHPSTHY